MEELIDYYKKKLGGKYAPSEYQAQFYDWIENGSGNAVIDAKAGSGKTHSMLEALSLIDKSKTKLFIAFNRSIVHELKEKVAEKGLKKVTISTLHSLGQRYMYQIFGKETSGKLDQYKYKKLIKSRLCEFSTAYEDEHMERDELKIYQDVILSIINFGRLNLCKDVEELKKVAKHYDIPLCYDECEVAYRIMESQKDEPDGYDFTDMLWLPTAMNLSSERMTYDWVLLDECQDASKAAIALFMKSVREDSRHVSCGDPFQMINGFAGASEEAFKYLCDLPDTRIFKLPISYRCCKAVIDFTRKVFPKIDIKPRPDAMEGEVIDDVSLKELKDGDMVLCRLNAPIFKLYVHFMKEGVASYIKGGEDAKKLRKLIEAADKYSLNPNMDKDGLILRLYVKVLDTRDSLMRMNGLTKEEATMSPTICNLYDSVSVLSILSEGITTSNKLLKRLDKVFDDKKDGIILSTVHKSKGLEADRVFIMCRSLMPSKKAKQPWEVEQEENLIYVAYTRAKETLGFIAEDETSDFMNGQGNDILRDLSYAERQAYKILKRNPIEDIDGGDASFSRMRLKNRTRIDRSDLKLAIRKKERPRMKKTGLSVDEMLKN